MMSYGRTRRQLVLRQFCLEASVSQYAAARVRGHYHSVFASRGTLFDRRDRLSHIASQGLPDLWDRRFRLMPQTFAATSGLDVERASGRQSRLSSRLVSDPTEFAGFADAPDAATTGGMAGLATRSTTGLLPKPGKVCGIRQSCRRRAHAGSFCRRDRRHGSPGGPLHGRQIFARLDDPDE